MLPKGRVPALRKVAHVPTMGRMQVAKDTVVMIDYTLTGPDGAVIDSSKGREPLAYLHGASNIIPGLENALTGKAAGEGLTVTVPPEQGYGKHDPAMVAPVPRAQLKNL